MSTVEYGKCYWRRCRYKRKRLQAIELYYHANRQSHCHIGERKPWVDTTTIAAGDILHAERATPIDNYPLTLTLLPAKQHINLQIGAHNVSLDIPREAEPLYRNAAVTLNERYQYYQRRMLKASAEQLWLYVALELAVNLHADAREKSLKPIHEKLEVLNQLIESCLQNENSEGNGK